jgi:hypothetical protein
MHKYVTKSIFAYGCFGILVLHVVSTDFDVDVLSRQLPGFTYFVVQNGCIRFW